MRIQMMMSQALRIKFLSFNISMLTAGSIFQAFLISSNSHTIENDDVNSLYSTFIKTILLAAEHSIPKVKSKKISEHTGTTWWSKHCKQAVSLKKEQLKK